MTEITPIILHHGLFGVGSFKGVDRAIAGAGYPVFVSSVHPCAGIEKRARQLRDWISSIASQFAGQRAILIAHSMGGLDARFMLSHLEIADKIESLVTISTPHRGSPYADWCSQNLGRRLRGFEVIRRFGLDVQGILDLTLERCARFNEITPDVPEVRYFSISATNPWRQMPAFGMPAWYIIHRLEGQNDGQVSVSSAKWATHLKTWNADHWRCVNQRYSLAAIKAGDISPEYLAILRQITKPQTDDKNICHSPTCPSGHLGL